MRKYEIMYVLKPELGEEATKAEIAKLADILTNNGAVVNKTTEWGLKDFAYEMEGFKKDTTSSLRLRLIPTRAKLLRNSNVLLVSTQMLSVI